MFDIIEFTAGNLKEWDSYVDQNANSTIYHRTEWLELCEKNQKLDLIKLGFRSDGKLVGIFPLFVRKYFFLKVGASPFIVEDTPYLGTLLDSDDLTAPAIRAIDDYSKKNNIHFIRLIYPQKVNVGVFENAGYRHFTRHTHILDLSHGLDRIWENMKGRARTAIRKSDKSGVRVYISEENDTMVKYYELSTELYKRQHKVPPNSPGFYSDICFGNLKTNSNLVVAALDDVIIACAIIVVYKETVYYLDAVSDRNYNKYCANSGLQWFIIKWACENNFKYYDFVGSDFPWIASFKESFGGELMEYSLLEKSSSPLVRVIRECYGNKFKPFMQKIKSKALPAILNLARFEPLTTEP